MLPVLLHLSQVKIYTFGLFLVLAFFWGAFLLWKNFRLTSYKEEDIFDGLFWSISGGILIARIVYVVLNFDKFGIDILKFILINGYPGLSLYGFIVGGLTSLYIFFLTRKIRFLDAMNYFVSPMFVALGFAKLGSFFSGVEAGGKTNFILSIKYFGFEGLRHLTPFYESMLFFGAAYLSYKILFDVRRQKFAHGFNFYFFCWYFGAVYFVMDFLKPRHVILYGQSLNSLLSLVLLLTFSFYFLYYFRSLLFGRVKQVKSSVSQNVKKNQQKFHSRTSKKPN